jgi:hypothetical protein
VPGSQGLYQLIGVDRGQRVLCEPVGDLLDLREGGLRVALDGRDFVAAAQQEVRLALFLAQLGDRRPPVHGMGLANAAAARPGRGQVVNQRLG